MEDDKIEMALRWGLAGADLISHDFATAVATLPVNEHKVVAVAAKDLKRAEKFAGYHNIRKAYEGYEQLAKDENIDIVYVAVPNPQHFEVAKLMLHYNKHVLCEKPMCLNYNETKTLIDLAKSKNLFLLEGMWSRFFPAYEALDKHLKSGGLGDILQVIVEFGVETNEDERMTMRELGGGTVLDLGVYALQFAQLVFKEEPIHIVCGGHLNSIGIDESMSCILTYSNGRTATLTTHSKTLLGNTAVINGTEGTLKLQTFWAPTVFQTSAADITEWQLPQGAYRFNFHNSGGLVYEMQECRKCIQSGLIESPKMTHEESLSLSKLEDKLRKQLGVVFPQDEQN